MGNVVTMHGRQGMTDEERLVAVGCGDRTAFRAVFEGFAPRIKSYLMRLGASGALAEDLAQDAMVQVWRKASSYDPSRAKASTWIFVIARNAWIDKLRREKVELAYRTAAEPEPEEPESPDAAAERREAEAQVAVSLGALSREQQEVIRLSFFEDKPHSEIAETLALPLGTVKSRLRLALTKLRAHWKAAQ